MLLGTASRETVRPERGVRVIPYQIIRRAIVDRRSLTAIYDNYVRHFSPHVLGKDRQFQTGVVGFQYGGGRPGGLSAVGDWCFFALEGLRDLQPNGDGWVAGPNGNRPSGLIVTVDIYA